MRRLAIVLVFGLFLSAGALEHQQRCEADEHQQTAADVQIPAIPAAAPSASTGLPPASTKTNDSQNEPWNYREAFAPSTLNGWVLAALAAVAAFIAVKTLCKISAQVEVEQRSLDLMRDEYAATHRPRIKVRTVSLDLPAEGLTPSQLYQTKLSFTVVNHGESEAALVDARYAVFIAEALPTPPSYQSEFLSNIPRRKLSAGEPACIVVTGKQYPLWRVLNDNKSLIVVGYITYRGTGGVTYRTAFGRQFMPGGRFVKVKDPPDYEYEE